jgi:hypothetical protein
MADYPTAAALAAAMKTEILQLIADGTIPATVATFSELHDYVDANMLGEDLYGEYPEDEDAAEEMMEAWTAAFNPASNTISAWLAAGRPE